MIQIFMYVRCGADVYLGKVYCRNGECQKSRENQNAKVDHINKRVRASIKVTMMNRKANRAVLNGAFLDVDYKQEISICCNHARMWVNEAQVLIQTQFPNTLTYRTFAADCREKLDQLFVLPRARSLSLYDYMLEYFASWYTHIVFAMDVAHMQITSHYYFVVLTFGISFGRVYTSDCRVNLQSSGNICFTYYSSKVIVNSL